MRSYQVTHNEGENMGPIDWSYDFMRHYSGLCTDEANKCERMARDIEMWFQVEHIFLRRKTRAKVLASLYQPDEDNKVLQVLDGDYWRKVIDICMYDGWPYWKPTPAMFLSTWHMGDWHFPGIGLYDFRLAERPAQWRESIYSHIWR